MVADYTRSRSRRGLWDALYRSRALAGLMALGLVDREAVMAGDGWPPLPPTVMAALGVVPHPGALFESLARDLFRLRSEGAMARDLVAYVRRERDRAAMEQAEREAAAR
jgi:hypothetical protein